MTELLRAPLNTILPALIPIALEKGESGYLDAPAIERDERKLSQQEIRPILAVAIYLGALDYTTTKGFDWDRVVEAFDKSLGEIVVLTKPEQERTNALTRKKVRTPTTFRV